MPFSADAKVGKITNQADLTLIKGEAQ